MAEHKVDVRRKGCIGCADWKIARLRDDRTRLSRHAAQDPKRYRIRVMGLLGGAAQKIVLGLVDVDE